MQFENMSDEFRKNLMLVGICLLIVAGAAGLHNFVTPNEDTRVGYTEIWTECRGIDAGVCIGLERQQYKTYNYDNYTKPEEGSENYYRRIESELMVRAYNTCTSEMSGYDWTSEVTYEGKTAAEWRQNENVELLPCEQTFYRSMDQN